VRRLDAELVARGLARSRAEAHRAIEEGRVLVDGIPSMKPARTVSAEISVKLVSTEKSYVSRGAFKLIGALDTFGIDLSGKVVLDAGASTGGFTEVALERGANHVIAVDVGYGQLAWSLRSDSRVTVMERTNVRSLLASDLVNVPDVIVADLSFISLVTVLPALSGVLGESGEMILMVKPQFEAGRDLVSINHGVIRDPQVRADCVLKVALAASDLGWRMQEVSASPLPGPKGNVEYFLWLTHIDQPASLLNQGSKEELLNRITKAVAEGPQ
jgi:23S rRNA (cytidine1920-2'-O)/16S rRNA (cytidine1409-2'-O)-methyltransferase